MPHPEHCSVDAIPSDLVGGWKGSAIQFDCRGIPLLIKLHVMHDFSWTVQLKSLGTSLLTTLHVMHDFQLDCPTEISWHLASDQASRDARLSAGGEADELYLLAFRPPPRC